SVANTDPPHKIDDGKAPSDRDIDAPDTNAFEQQITDGSVEHAEDRSTKSNNQDPKDRRVLGKHNAGDAVRDRAEGLAGADDRRPYAFRWQNVNLSRGHSLRLLRLIARLQLGVGVAHRRQ